jgi:hypothetical protein
VGLRLPDWSKGLSHLILFGVRVRRVFVVIVGRRAPPACLFEGQRQCQALQRAAGACFWMRFSRNGGYSIAALRPR